MTPHASRILLALLGALLLAPAPRGAEPDRPRLIVILAVDQMRADYLDKFDHQWTRGLRRLVDEGAVFEQAAHSYFGTLTCAGHATIATGALPATHGVILDGWWDAQAGRRIRCTADPSAAVVRYGTGGREQHGPATLMVPTLSDELRGQLGVPPRIVALAVKGRAAIPLAGHRADAVAWFDDGNSWTTSTAFTPAPVPALAEFVAANPVEADRGRQWSPSLPASAYLYGDALEGTDGRAEVPPFTHRLPDADDADADEFYTAWRTSPFSDDYVGRLAEAAVDGLELGQGTRTDYLAIGFSGADYVGHEFGPRSLEVQEEFVRLDATLGRLLDHLDRAVGPDRYVVALTADHGVAPIPEWAVEHGFDAGRIDRGELVERVNAALEPFLGPGEHAVAMVHIEFSFAPGVYDRLLADPAAMQAALDAIRSNPGVARVYRREELESGTARDPLTRQVAASYYPGRSGELVIIPKPYWYTWNRGADHGTGYAYDTRVPLILMGSGVRPGRYRSPADPTDIAPTLAALAGVTLAQSDGRVLAEALER
jgi:predicted AlkP superfamily pyrophosphatase or phosphodiesterase